MIGLKKSKKERSDKSDNDHKKEVDEVRAQLARALADYDNLRKRIDKESENQEKKLKARVITKFLQVFDMLNDIQNNINDTGLAIAINSFKDILREEEVVEIKADPGMKFDEELHEAVDVTTEEDRKDDEIVILQQAGWMFKNGQIIRFAKVVVNKLNNVDNNTN